MFDCAFKSTSLFASITAISKLLKSLIARMIQPGFNYSLAAQLEAWIRG